MSQELDEKIEYRFEGIESRIIELLDAAKSEIWIAVYLFTSHRLFNSILNRLNAGVKVHILLHDDATNHSITSPPFNELLSRGADLAVSIEKPMHNKFCIIDGEILVTGSYNWTFSAENINFENVIITREKNLIAAYFEEFNRIKLLLKPIGDWHQISMVESAGGAQEAYQQFISKEIVAGAKETSQVPQLSSLPKLFKKPDILVFSIGIGLQNDVYLPLIPSGEIPTGIIETEVVTAHDQQRQLHVKVLFGENKEASKNKLISTLQLDDIKALPKGSIKSIVSIRISEEGYLVAWIKQINEGYNYYNAPPISITNILI